MTPPSPDQAVATRLARRLGTSDAVVIGLGSMIGAGVFAAFGPAAGAAGNGLIVGLALAALVAFCNATSSAQLAALYPESGGTYAYGRARLGDLWGFLAGWGFIIGKIASCAAMAMTFGSYAAPELARPAAIAAVVVVTAVNYLGVKKTVAATRIIVSIVLLALALVVLSVWLGGAADVGRIWPVEATSFYGVLQAAGFLFFAFAGYARIATLGEEVVDPARTIPRAIPIALGITLLVYVTVALSALAGAGAGALASSSAPLATAVQSGTFAWAAPVVRVGAIVASLGALLSLVVGVSRTVFAMADKGDLPRRLAVVHARYQVPHRAEVAVGAIVVVITAVADIRQAISFSSLLVLTYYAITNVAALTLAPAQRRWPRALAVIGLCGCLVLGATLPLSAVIGGPLVLLIGVLVFVFRRRAARAQGKT